MDYQEFYVALLYGHRATVLKQVVIHLEACRALPSATQPWKFK